MKTPLPSPRSAAAPGAPAPTDSSSRTRSLRPGIAVLLPAALGLALAGMALLVPRAQAPELFHALLGAGLAVLAGCAILFLAARRAGRPLELETAVYRHHWVQACAQFSIFLWWGWHIRFVYAYFPLLLSQLIFAYAVDALLSWGRRGRFSLGFGPFPIVFSINLFLWFRPEFFQWQFAMVAGGYLAKEFIRWDKGGRSAHIFNPSSFPLAVAALVLIVTGTSEATLGRQIVTSQFNVPLIYLAIFLAALPGQLLFGVARMTMTAVVTLFAISVLYFAADGTYLFYDAHIPVPVFLGMHLLFTDPSTSPRAGFGRVIFGMLYAVGVAVSFVLLGWIGAPTYFDKLLPLPILNLLVRRIDAFTASPRFRVPLVSGERPLTPGQRNLAYTSLWGMVFLGLSAVGGVGDRHPGHALPFWEQACQEGNERACQYVTYRTSVYCAEGSGWACNEWALRHEDARAARAGFRRGCELGFAPACENGRRDRIAAGPPARAPVPERELPIVLSWKEKVEPRRPPAELRALACEQGWGEMCGG